MAKGRTKTEKQLDEIYREHPSGFVAARNALAKGIGGKEGARVKKLKRPTQAAWLLNNAVLSEPGAASDYSGAIEALESAQAKGLSGKGAERWRAAAARESGAVAALVRAAGDSAREAGHAPTDRALQQVEETLRAAAGDAELRDLVLRGRLDRERSGASLGGLVALSTDAGEEDPGDDDRDREEAQREAERLTEELDGAERRQADLERELAEVKREAKELRKSLGAAKKML